MQRKETAIEVKVGALVLVSILLFGGFVFVLGDFRFGDAFYVYVDFPNAGGLKPGADVRIAGYPAGSVDEIQFLGGRYDEGTGRNVYVRVRLAINEGMQGAIGQGAGFVITTLGVLGEPYVEVINTDPPGAPIEADSIWVGIPPLRTDQMFRAVYEGVQNLDVLIATVDRFFRESDLERLLHEAANLSQSLDTLIRRNSDGISGTVSSLNYILEENRDSIAPILENVENATAELETLTVSLNRALDGGRTLRRTLENVDVVMREAAAAAPETFADLQSAMDSVERILSEREEAISNSLANVEVLSENLVALSGDAAELMDYVNQGRGSLGAILRDDELYDDFREFVRELKRRPWRLLWRE
jgi:phospholipid/cholesterol/gamma-HCH transport system substrate-binding protein